MWWGLLASILFISTVVLLRSGPVAALGCGVLTSFLFPCWIHQDFIGVPIDLRVATSLVLLMVNLFHPDGRISWRFSVGDWAVFVLYFVHVASDTWQDGFQLAYIPRAFGEWSIPYIAGRLAIQNVQDWRWLTQFAVILATLCALWASTEAVTRVNIGNPIFGERPVDRTPPMAIRGGFKRAEGPTRCSIWFGMIQTLLLPWVFVAAERSLRGDGPIWWLATPLFSTVGILATLSRGPAIAGITIFYLMIIFYVPKVRWYLVGAGILLAGIGFATRDQVLASLEKLEAPKWDVGQQPTNEVEFDGRQYRFTAMSARWLMFYAYRPAVMQTGFLGYGTERTATFPVNVPLGPDAQQTIRFFWTIDCEYLLLVLRFGWCGLLAFTAICIGSTLRILHLSQYIEMNERLFLNAIAATLISLSLTLLVEWMPHDYGFLFLWVCGVANGPRRRLRLDTQ